MFGGIVMDAIKRTDGIRPEVLRRAEGAIDAHPGEQSAPVDSFVKKGKPAAAPVAGDAAPTAPALATSTGGISLVLIIAAAGTLLIGVWPTPWATWITQAVQAVFGR